MDRRLFLTGLVALAGSAAATSIVLQAQAFPLRSSGRGGILGELDRPSDDVTESDAEPTLVQWGPGPYRRRRPVWRRYCRSYWRRGRRIVRCHRRRVWVWY